MDFELHLHRFHDDENLAFFDERTFFDANLEDLPGHRRPHFSIARGELYAAVAERTRVFEMKRLAEHAELHLGRVDYRRGGLDAHAGRLPPSLIHRALERRGKARAHRRFRQSVRDPVAPQRRVPSDGIHLHLDTALLATAADAREVIPEPAKTSRETADGAGAAKRHGKLLAKAGRQKPCLETFR